jgi:hypothetical protein
MIFQTHNNLLSYGTVWFWRWVPTSDLIDLFFRTRTAVLQLLLRFRLVFGRGCLRISARTSAVLSSVCKGKSAEWSTYRRSRWPCGLKRRSAAARLLGLRVWMAVRSKAWVCGRSLTGIVGSNSTGGMDVCVVFVVRTIVWNVKWHEGRKDLNSPKMDQRVKSPDRKKESSWAHECSSLVFR